MRYGLLAAAILWPAAASALAGDWPTYLHDNARSGVTAESPELPLTEQWVYRAPAVPKPAWPDPQPEYNELPRVKFDDALYTVAVGNSVYFGSSVDNQVYALDAATGSVRWRFFTSGPIRLAPTVAKDRVYVGSDDGKVYCLAADDGRLLWEFNAAPKPKRVIGNGRIISLWPVRTSVLVDGDRLFFGSGIFPYHSPRLVSLNAETGQLIPWKDLSPKSWLRLSPEGYLLRSGRGLIVPCGRTMPVAVDCETGNLLHRPGPWGRQPGGAYVALVGTAMYVGTQNTLHAYDVETGKALSQWSPARKIVSTPEAYYVLKGPLSTISGRQKVAAEHDEITAIDRARYDQAPRQDDAARTAATRWRYKHPDLVAMILAGDRLVAGCKDEVTVMDTRDGMELWKSKVDGDAVGLAFAHGRLFVSTTRGAIHCFAKSAPPIGIPQPVAEVWPPNPSSAIIEQTAEGILRESGVDKGYALITGFGAARLACELAKRTELVITCVESDPNQLLSSRQRVDSTGLYGRRVTVETGSPEKWPYPDYAANLVVHVDAPGEKPYVAQELLRVLKPCGGVMMLGSMTHLAERRPPEAATLNLWKKAGALSHDTATMQAGAPWTKLVRGVLEGSGWWTHCYADAGNTGSSGDRRIQGELDVLWFGEPGANEFPDRHARNVSPLVMNGRVFCQGWRFAERKNTLLCFDAYNGVRYWQREIPGAIRLWMPAFSGNLACTADSLFVAAGSKCHRLDAVTGDTKSVYETPPAQDKSNPPWGYVAVANGILFGSTTASELSEKRPNDARWISIFGSASSGSRFSDSVFAFDIESGKQLWVHRGKEIRDSTIVLGSSGLFFAENRGRPAEDNAGQGDLETTINRFGEAVKSSTPGPLIRTVVGLNATTGKLTWEKEADLTGCGKWEPSAPRESPGFAELQGLLKDDVLVLAGAYHQHASAKDAGSRRATALSALDGSVLWSTSVANLNRPIILGDKLLAGPYVRDLRTGAILQKQDPKTGELVPWSMIFRTSCGTPSACDALVFFRSGYTNWRNILGGSDGTFLGIRPGCFINIIPAGGVVVQPEASSGCTCSLAIQCTIAFSPSAAPPEKPESDPQE